MRLDYFCDSCGVKKTNLEMESFACGCGGTMKVYDQFMVPPPFDAGWCRTLKCEVTSWRDQERKAAAHRSYAHPHGFSMVNDNKPWLRELRNIRKHKSDYLKSTLPGYKHGEEKKVYNANRPDIHRSGKRIYSIPR